MNVIDVASTISWQMAITIDVNTGEFLDVSRQHPDFFQQNIPYFEWKLATMLSEDKPGEELHTVAYSCRVRMPKRAMLTS